MKVTLKRLFAIDFCDGRDSLLLDFKLYSGSEYYIKELVQGRMSVEETIETRKIHRCSVSGCQKSDRGVPRDNDP